VVARNLVFLSVGSALCAVAINGILVPHSFLSGGAAGVALVIHYLVPAAPVSALYLAMNVPLFLAGWRQVGRRFFLYSLVGMGIFTVMLAWLRMPIPTVEPVPAALLAGILSGLGAGLILRSHGCAGGTDILGVILFRRWSVRLGTTALVFNASVLTAGALLFGVDRALYTLTYMYVSARCVDVVVTGLSQRKAVTLVSSRWEEVCRFVTRELQRGVTVLEAHGGYTGREEKLVYAVVTFRELARLKREVRALDPEAFVVVSDTLEVMGQRIGNQPHW
jgi:uncharacterized membrane-anchored protein YitT (DUF2179 family)